MSGSVVSTTTGLPATERMYKVVVYPVLRAWIVAATTHVLRLPLLLSPWALPCCSVSGWLSPYPSYHHQPTAESCFAATYALAVPPLSQRAPCVHPCRCQSDPSPPPRQFCTRSSPAYCAY
eukprot:scaffold2367_cov376-Prasinococcus_capsulatus_cf.AAC.2